jgi:hypothetical protein
MGALRIWKGSILEISPVVGSIGESVAAGAVSRFYMVSRALAFSPETVVGTASPRV